MKKFISVTFGVISALLMFGSVSVFHGGKGED